VSGAGGLGPLLVGLGAGLVVIGLVVWSGAVSWFGRLPGDIRIERESVHLYLPLTSMLLVSVGLSLVAYLVRRFLP
jgi:hypothetical protein